MTNKHETVATSSGESIVWYNVAKYDGAHDKKVGSNPFSCLGFYGDIPVGMRSSISGTYMDSYNSQK